MIEGESQICLSFIKPLKDRRRRSLNTPFADHAKYLVAVIIPEGIIYLSLFVLHLTEQNGFCFIRKILSHLFLRPDGRIKRIQ